MMSATVAAVLGTGGTGRASGSECRDVYGDVMSYGGFLAHGKSNQLLEGFSGQHVWKGRIRMQDKWPANPRFDCVNKTG